MTLRTSPRCSSLLVASLIAASGCGSDPSPNQPDGGGSGTGTDSGSGGSDGGGSNIEARLRKSFETWKAGIRKDCSVEAVFEGRQVDPEDPDPSQLDAAMVLAKLDGKPWIRDASGELAIIGPPVLSNNFGSGTHRYADSEEDVDIVVGATLQSGGDCVVTIDEREVFRGFLWKELPVIAYANPIKEPAVAEGDITIFARDGATQGAAFLTIDALRVVNFGLDTLPIEPAQSLVGRALGLTADEAAPFVADGKTWFDDVVADAATAPLSLLGEAGRPAPPAFTDPTVAIDLARLADWVPATGSVTRDLVVHIEALPERAGPSGTTRLVELPVRVSLQPLPDARMRARLIGVGDPRQSARSSARTVECLRSVAAATLAYVRQPEDDVLQSMAPFALMAGQVPVVQPGWLLTPCRLLSEAYATELLDPEVLRLIGGLLDAREYRRRNPGIIPRGWGNVLAELGPDEAHLTTLESGFGAHAVLEPASVRQRALMADARYQAEPSATQLKRRALVWHSSFVCRPDLSDSQLDRLIKVPAAKLDDLLGTNQCSVPVP